MSNPLSVSKRVAADTDLQTRCGSRVPAVTVYGYRTTTRNVILVTDAGRGSNREEFRSSVRDAIIIRYVRRTSSAAAEAVISAVNCFVRKFRLVFPEERLSASTVAVFARTPLFSEGVGGTLNDAAAPAAEVLTPYYNIYIYMVRRIYRDPTAKRS